MSLTDLGKKIKSDHEAIWDGARPAHGRGFWAALRDRGIKVAKPSSAGRVAKRSLYIWSSYPGNSRVPDSRVAKASSPANTNSPAKSPFVPSSGPTIDLRRRVRGLTDWLDQNPTKDNLFRIACAFAVHEGLLTPSQGMALVENSVELREEIGRDEFRRTVANAFRFVEEKILDASEPKEEN
jgi:hypothetical protein